MHPSPPDIHAFAAAGKRLMEIHIDYEKQPEYKLEQLEDPKAEVTFRVERMKLSKDKTELTYNDFLKLRGVPAAAFDYRSATVPPSNGSSTSTASPPTPAPASSTTPTEKTTPNTSSASSARSSPSPLKPRR